MAHSNAIWLPLCYHSANTIFLRLPDYQWIANPTNLLPIQCHSTTTALLLSQLNPLPITCHWTATVLPLSQWTTTQDKWIPNWYFQWTTTQPRDWTTTVLPLSQWRTTQVIWISMNNHSAIPLPIKCHWTANVLPLIKVRKWSCKMPIEIQSYVTWLPIRCQLTPNLMPIEIQLDSTPCQSNANRLPIDMMPIIWGKLR